MRGIELKIATQNFDRERFVLLHGGYKDLHRVELWLIPSGASPPRPRSSVHLRNVNFSSKTRTGIEPYDCCEDNAYLWKRLKP